LARKGLLAHEGKNYQSSAEADLLIGRLLLIDHAIKIQAGRLSDDASLVRVDIQAIQGGLNDLLLWEKGENAQVHWKSVSPDQLINIMLGLLANGEALKTFEAKTPTAAPAATTASSHKFCPGCGKPITAGVKFCKGCGKALR
jgi:hypothetical protein